ncbi:MAG: hypothetical protein ACRDH2_06215 [Anaerolineales bacterium]
MNFLLALHQPHWQTVFTIPKETVLQKGRRHGLYHDLTRAAQAIPEQFNCYTWGSETVVFYCGSFAHDYLRGGFKTNLQGRVHHYLQNHKRDARTGRANTNAMVFDNLSAALTHSDILLRVLRFESLQVADDTIDFATFSTDPVLVHTVEALLICLYRRQGQCEWNRA